MECTPGYSVSAVRQRIFRATSPLIQKSIENAPEVLDALVFQQASAPKGRNTPSGTLFSSTKRALSARPFSAESSVKSHEPQTKSAQFMSFQKSRKIQCEQDFNEQKWHGKEDFQRQLRERMRTEFQNVERGRQVQECMESCRELVRGDQRRRDSEMQLIAQQNERLQRENARLDLDARKLQIQIDDLLRGNQYVKLRIDNEQKELARLQQCGMPLLREQTDLQAVHSDYAFIEPRAVLDRIEALEETAVKTYIREFEARDEVDEIVHKTRQIQQLYSAEYEAQRSINQRTVDRLEEQAARLRAEQAKLEEDAMQAEYAQRQLQTVTAQVQEFFTDWSRSLFQLLDFKLVERLEAQPSFDELYKQETDDPLETLQILSNIAELIAQQSPGVNSQKQSLVVKRSTLGQFYKKIALQADAIQKELYFKDTKLSKDVCATVERVTNGAVDGELRKQKKMQDIQVIEQDIVKLAEIRDEMDKWQLQVVEELENLLERQKIGAE